MSQTIARRHFLRLGALPAAAAVLPAGQPVSCILLWQGGGASHVDTFDPKPSSPFRSIPANAPGVRISEALPRTAAQMDKIAVLRGMRAQDTNHERAAAAILNALPQYAEARPDALALALESPSLRSRYGRTPMGERCLMARRMAQRGERFIYVACPDFDAHADHTRALRERVLPEFDRAFAALVEDLHERRMLDRTLVVAAGEFGRTPRFNGQGGRDHHAEAWSVCLAGSGVRGGRVLGATDETGERVVEMPVSPEDLACTMRRLAGFEAAARGRFIAELLG
ncbi:MAG: DUF1501 domain-containing protein [Bryobacteraceae bacterium]